jgi:hypothetical protein
MAAALAVATDRGAALSASAVQPRGDVEILVNGVPQPRYPHDGRWYVEAAKGREYAIRLHNPYPVRVAIALSVDGLNSIDARETTPSSGRKWVLGPYETITISGWQVSRSEARRFEFTTEERSYGQALGKTANLGVISAVFFRERLAVVSRRELRDNDSASPQAAPDQVPAPAAESAARAFGSAQKAEDEYAATGMGRRTGHEVTLVSLDLEDRPAQAIDIRYEFRPQLVRLGILPPAASIDRLDRRERARGFEPEFAPER